MKGVEMSTMTQLRPLLWARCGGHCEVSGRAIYYETFDAHHRRPKGMGGTERTNSDSLENLLALHPEVHNPGPDSVHGNPAWARERGYLLPKHVDWPGTWPVLLHGRWWVLLDSNGRYHPMPPGIPPMPRVTS